MSVRALQPWEQRLLRLVSEQGAIPLDQLARFIGGEEAQAARMAWHLVDDGLAICRPVLHGEPPWLWPTFRGNRASGTGLPRSEPTAAGLERIRAVNEVRLHIAARAPAARWICGRAVRQEQGKRGPSIQAVVEAEGELHALVVRPGRMISPVPKEIRRVEPLLARYAIVVVFFASPRVGRHVERLRRENGYRNLIVRPIPGPAPSSA